MKNPSGLDSFSFDAINNCNTVVALPMIISAQAELQEKEQQKQQAIDDMRDKKTGLERTVELKRDLQGKKQQELRSIRAELQRLEGSSSRLQELESELSKAVSMWWDHTFDSVPHGLTAPPPVFFSAGTRVAERHSELQCGGAKERSGGAPEYEGRPRPITETAR